MEYLSVYNDKKEKLPKVIARGTKLKENEHILITTIIIKNKQNEYLIQKSSLKNLMFKLSISFLSKIEEK